jgi:Ca2+-transporting ATPase
MVGDILMLEKGDLIPADGIVLESFALLVDESSMTGESDMIEKSTVCPTKGAERQRGGK